MIRYNSEGCSMLYIYLCMCGYIYTLYCVCVWLGNNDGRNLSAPEQFKSKEISKSNVVDDMVASNR